MGWWKIENVKTGRHDHHGHEIKKLEDLNASLYNGDGPADAMGDTLRRIAEMYRESFGRGPKLDELHACVNFCANPWANDEGVFEPWVEPEK
jgi:hypothetical protein